MTSGLVVLGDPQRAFSTAVIAAGMSAAPVRYAASSEAQDAGVADADARAGVEPIDPRHPFEVDAAVVATSAGDLRAVIEPWRRQLAGRPLLLAPGGAGGALRVEHWFEEWRLEAPLIGETIGWIGAAVRQDDGVRVAVRKHALPIATTRPELDEPLLDVFRRYLPDAVRSDLVTVSLSNINTVGHPPLALLNAARMETGEQYELWGGGLSNGVVALMTAVDDERRAVIRALGGESVSVWQIMHRLYGPEGFARVDVDADRSTVVRQATAALRGFGPYRGYPGPSRLEDRFLTDDVPWGVAVFEGLASMLGLPHAASTSVRVLAETLLDRRLRPEPFVLSGLLSYAEAHRGFDRGATAPSSDRSTPRD